MFHVIAFLCLVLALGLLIALALVDLRTWLLPDKLVFPLLLAGTAFHFATAFAFVTPVEILSGIAMGAGLLWIVRIAAFRFYGEDALGLGDVKLMGAAGAWLGPQDIILALILGSLAGILHGLGIATVKKQSLKTLSLPAGPGFILGIVIVGFIKFRPLLYASVHTDYILSGQLWPL